MGHTVLGILAHVDAGKTTLSEQLLFASGALREPGRVDRQTALMDHAPVEKQRGITVFSDQAEFTVRGRAFSLIDTPGHVDFSGEMERCLQVLDCAILVVSAVEGVQAHTETVWRLLQEANRPVFVFINKTDREGADVQKVLNQLQKLGEDRFFLMDAGLSETGEWSEEAAEYLASLDETLLETYLSQGCDPALWIKQGEKLVRERKWFPVYTGSALAGQGIAAFLFGLSLLAPNCQGDSNAPFSGRVYKVRHEKGGRVVFLKVEQGVLHPKDQLLLPSGEEEKCNELRKYQGEKYQLLKEADPGCLCAVTGVLQAKAGQLVGAGAEESAGFSMVPLLSAKVLFPREESPVLMLQRFRQLEDEEPLLGVEWTEQTQEIRVKVMGEVQLEVLQEVFQERFQKQISFGPCSVLYRETLEAPVVGCGHFEPLRHYAEVHLLLSPSPRGSGITFDSACPLDELSGNWQNLVGTHVLEKDHKGVLTGAPLTDVQITLLSGRAHLKHTEGGDFRQATYRAIRQGLMMGQSILLEPWCQCTAAVERNLAGKVQGDLLKMEGICTDMEDTGEEMVIHGKAPLATLMEYPKEFVAFTRGRGRFTMTFSGYEPCRDPQAVIEAVGYDLERDVENPPDSIFCSHGAKYGVKWDQAYDAMHLPVETVEEALKKKER